MYDVFWFINGINVTEHKNIPFIDLGSTVLKEAEWTNNFSMNMEVIIIKLIDYNFLFSCRYLMIAQVELKTNTPKTIVPSISNHTL